MTNEIRKAGNLIEPKLAYAVRKVRAHLRLKKDF